MLPDAAGVEPPGCAALAPGTRVWLGDPDLPPSSRGVVVLGVRIGSPEFVQHRLQELLARQGPLLEQLPALEDVQVGLLMSCWAAPRAQHVLRTLPPAVVQDFAQGHDRAVMQCLAALLTPGEAAALPLLAVARAQLALQHGGLGLRSAVRLISAGARGLLGILG